MALTDNDFRLLFFSKKAGVSFKKTLMLGRLLYYGKLSTLNGFAATYNINPFTEKDIETGYSEQLLQLIGAEQTDSMDFSNYENATIIHDLNNPVEVKLHQQYSAIIDGGTIEHVFNFPQAISNCMNMIALNGHYIGITPCNNLMGHGFYQFSPELYFRIFSDENGFEMIKMIMVAFDKNGNAGEWFEIADPAKVKERITLSNHLPSYLMMIAKRNSIKPLFSNTPQQSDYSELWTNYADQTDQSKKEQGLTGIYKKIIPFRVRNALYPFLKQLRTKNIYSKEFGNLNEKHFRKMQDY